MLAAFGLTACNKEQKYSLTINGSELLYENLNTEYAVGEEVTVKVKIKPYEGVNVSLGTEQLVRVKSTQNDYWQFQFEMPAHASVLDIISYKGFDEPILYGYYLTFSDKNGEPLEAFNKPIDSKEAIADYAVIYYEDNHKIISSNEDANVFADKKASIADWQYEQEDTLYYTHELVGAVVNVAWVYIDEATQQIVPRGGDLGYAFDDIGGAMSVLNTQSLSDYRYTNQMKEYEEKFNSLVKINFSYIDYLTGVKVLEYDKNNEIIKSTEIEKSESEITHTVSENCEYAVIQEEYTKKDGNIYYERILIDKNNSELGKGNMLKYPRGDGLISPIYLHIKW